MITSISVAVAALAFLVGVNAWRREFVGKRRIDLIENVLALFYEAQDAIREIRSPFGLSGEGATRKRSDYEREEESQVLDQAYVVFERYQKRKKLFAELRSIKYRVMATFGSDAGESFDELNAILTEIFSAAHILGTHYWKRQGRICLSDDEFQKHLDGMSKFEAIFWFQGEGNDEIAPRVQRAVEKIETIARKESMMKVTGFGPRKKKSQKS